MRKILYIIITLFVCNNSHSQSFQNKETGIAAYNIAFGMLIGGVGSCINKPKEESIQKAFFRGATRGALGGSLTFVGKKMTYLIVKEAEAYNFRENPRGFNYNSFYYGWAAKVIHSTGVSIIENAGRHEGFLENWSTELGVIRVNYNFKENKPQARVLITRIIGAIESEKYGNFDAGKSLALGQLYFNADFIHAQTEGYSGRCRHGSVSVCEHSTGLVHQVAAHETIHSFQNLERMSMTTFAKKPIEKLSATPIGFLTKYIYLENYVGNELFLVTARLISNSYENKINELEAFVLTPKY